MKSHFRVTLGYTGLAVDCDLCLVHLATIAEGTLTLSEFEQIAREHACKPADVEAANASVEQIVEFVRTTGGQS